MSILQTKVMYIKEVKLLVHYHTACKGQKDIKKPELFDSKISVLNYMLSCFLVYGLMQLAIKHQNKYCIFFKTSLF